MQRLFIVSESWIYRDQPTVITLYQFNAVFSVCSEAMLRMFIQYVP